MPHPLKAFSLLAGTALAALLSGCDSCEASNDEPNTAPPTPALRDKFQTEGLSWEVIDGSWKVENGALIGLTGHIQTQTDITDATIDLDVELTEAIDRLYGLGFRFSLVQDDPTRKNGYALNFLGKSFNVLRGQNNRWISLLDQDPTKPLPETYVKSPEIDERKNHVTIVMKGKSFVISINGKEVNHFEDSVYSSGRLMLWVPDPGGQPARFTNIRVHP